MVFLYFLSELIEELVRATDLKFIIMSTSCFACFATQASEAAYTHNCLRIFKGGSKGGAGKVEDLH